MKNLLILFICTLSASAQSKKLKTLQPVLPQKQEHKAYNSSDEKVYTYAEEKAEFPGGEASCLKYLASRIRMPNIDNNKEITGSCLIHFIVEKDGSLSNIEVKKGGGVEKEALRVVSQMPKWNPAKVNGKPVRYKVILPIQICFR